MSKFVKEEAGRLTTSTRPLVRPDFSTSTSQRADL